MGKEMQKDHKAYFRRGPDPKFADPWSKRWLLREEELATIQTFKADNAKNSSLRGKILVRDRDTKVYNTKGGRLFNLVHVARGEY